MCTAEQVSLIALVDYAQQWNGKDLEGGRFAVQSQEMSLLKLWNYTKPLNAALC
jgi:hypothetical protein